MVIFFAWVKINAFNHINHSTSIFIYFLLWLHSSGSVGSANFSNHLHSLSHVWKFSFTNHQQVPIISCYPLLLSSNTSGIDISYNFYPLVLAITFFLYPQLSDHRVYRQYQQQCRSGSSHCWCHSLWWVCWAPHRHPRPANPRAGAAAEHGPPIVWVLQTGDCSTP